MEILETVLPIVIDILLVVLLTVGIILGIKCIYVVDKTKVIIDNVEDKVNSLNSLFKIVDLFTNKFSLFTDKIYEFFESLFKKIINKNKEEKDVEVVEIKKERKKKHE